MRKFTEISAMAIAVILGTSVMITGCGANGSQEADGEAAKTEEKSSAGGEDGVFTIAYAPNESTDQSTDARNGLAKDLEEALGCEVEEIQASDYNAIIEALRTGQGRYGISGSTVCGLGGRTSRRGTDCDEG